MLISLVVVGVGGDLNVLVTVGLVKRLKWSLWVSESQTNVFTMKTNSVFLTGRTIGTASEETVIRAVSCRRPHGRSAESGC